MSERLPRLSSALRRAFAVLCSAVLIGACATSAVYSPSLMLPVEPIAQHDAQVALGYALLPETRPAAIGRTTTSGLEMLAGYGFGSRVALRVKTWSDLATSGGVLLDAVIMLGDTTGDFRFALVPRAAALVRGRFIQGYGVALPVALWFPPLGDLRAHASLGPAIGIADLAFGFEGGYGLIASVGAGYRLTPRLAVNLEIVGVAQINSYDRDTSAAIAPALSLSYRF